MTDEAKAERLLSEVDLFNGVSRRQLKRLVSLGKEIEHGAGHTLAAEGLGALAFHLILSGEVSVHQAGKEIGRLRSGDHFGEISMIDGRARSASVVAETPVRVLAINRQQFLDLVDSEPAFARGVMAGLCARLRAAEARLTP
jgi:CRP/FNR family transcriptional regulator, cyclic AMP receptor protein